MGWKRSTIRGLDALGVFGAARALSRGRFLGATVLCYHRVFPDAAPPDHYVALMGDPTASQLESLITFLKRWFKFATVRECVERWSAGQEVDPYTLLLTFDDGYADMCDELLPVLRRQQVPATVFVTTGSIGGAYITWFQRLFSAVEWTSRKQLPDFPGVPPLPLRTPRQRVEAIEAVSAQQMHNEAAAWERLIDRLCDALGWDGNIKGERMMTWDQVEELHGSGLVQIGGHTVTHPLLYECSPEQARAELEDCAAELRGRLGLDFLPFSYPQGRVNPPWVQQLVREAGYACAFTGRKAANTSRTPLYSLGREHVPPNDLAMTSFLLSGIRRGVPTTAEAERAAAGEPVLA